MGIRFYRYLPLYGTSVLAYKAWLSAKETIGFLKGLIKNKASTHEELRLFRGIITVNWVLIEFYLEVEFLAIRVDAEDNDFLSWVFFEYGG